MDLTSVPQPLEDNGFRLLSPDPWDSSKDELEVLQEELKKWKERVEKAAKTKADLLQGKKSADEECMRAEEELTQLKELYEKQQKGIIMFRAIHEQQLCVLQEENAELMREIEKLQEELAECTLDLSQGGQIKTKVAEMQLKFTEMKVLEDGWPDMNIHCEFGGATKNPFRLNQNQALLTFEDEGVAQRLLKKEKHTVNLDSKTADVRVKACTLEMGMKMQLHVTISGKKINVSEVPALSIPDEWMRDKLELSFYKSERGGGEVENVEYDKSSGTAVITFLRPGATQNFVRCTKYPFFVSERCCRLSVSPYVDVHLEKFQIYSGVSTKTILLQGTEEMDADEESVQDMVQIHFQKPSNSGGEIENIKYVSKEAAWVCFEEDR